MGSSEQKNDIRSLNLRLLCVLRFLMMLLSQGRLHTIASVSHLFGRATYGSD